MYRALSIVCGKLRDCVFVSLTIIDDNICGLVDRDVGKHDRYLDHLFGRQRAFWHHLHDGTVVVLAVMSRSS